MSSKFSWRPTALSLLALLGLVTSLGVSAAPATAQQTAIVARYTGTIESHAELVKPSPQAIQANTTANVITFNAAQVGVAASSAQTLTATFAVSGYSGSFTPTATLHHGLNYSLGAVTCTVSGSSENCSVPVKFKPIYPGGRKDALFLMDGTTRLATVLLGGIGNAPFAFTQTESSVVSSTPFPGSYIYKSITDEDGTLYVLNHTYIGKVTAAGVATELTFSGNPYIYDFALDGAGVLYIATSFGNQMITYDTVQGIQGTFTLPTSDYWYPTASGISGSLFVVNQDTQKLFEFKPDETNTATAINPSVNQDYQLTLDDKEDVFISGYTINEIPAGGVQTQVNAVGAGDGLDVDAAGTLYATRYNPTGGVAMLPATDYSTPIDHLDGTSQPLGVSVGPDGTVNVSNYTTLDVVDRSHSQSVIDFGQIDTGTTSSAKAGAIYNGGNQPLILSDFSSDNTDFNLESSNADDCAPGIQVAPGAICQIVATFTPAHPGTYSTIITLKSNSLNASNSISTIKVSGASYGIYDVPSPATLNFGLQNTNTSVTKTVTLTNNGYYYSSSIYSLKSDTAAITVDQGTCSAALAVGASCTLNVTFLPTATQSYNGTVTVVTYVSGSSIASQTFTFAVTGTGKVQTTVATPVISSGTGTYHSNQTVTITDSTAGAKIYYTTDGSAPTTSSTLYSAPFPVSQTGTTIKAFATATGDADSAVASATYTLQVTTPVLSPPGGTYAGTQSVVITTTPSGAQIFYSTDGSDPSKGTLYTVPVSVSTSGTTIKAVGMLGGYLDSTVAAGTYTIQVPGASVTPSALSFGNQTIATTSAAQTSTLKNTGQATLQISSIAVTGANPSDFAQTNNCGISLAAGATCTISVTFTPADVASYSASVTVTSNAPNSPNAISLSGAGTAKPVPAASLTPASLTFTTDTGTTSIAQTATLKNTGNAALTISGITLAGANPSDFAQTNTCGSSLAAGASCSISVTFTPATASSFTATLSVADSATGSPQAVSLSGTGTVPPAPIASLTPSSLSFSATTGTTAVAQTATLKNTGNATLTIGGITLTGANPSDFAQTNTCGNSLAAGASCSISVTFTPASASSFSATLSVADSAAGAPQTATLSGAGTAPAQGDFTVSTTPSSATVTSGGAAQFNIVVGTSGGPYSSAVNLSVSGLPTGATASFSPASVTPGSGTATSVLTIQTAASTAANRSPMPLWPVGSPVLALLFFAIPRRIQRQWSRRVLLIVLMLVSLGAGAAMIGCGGGFALPHTSTTSTVTITATSGSNVHTTTVQLTVK